MALEVLDVFQQERCRPVMAQDAFDLEEQVALLDVIERLTAGGFSRRSLGLLLILTCQKTTPISCNGVFRRGTR